MRPTLFEANVGGMAIELMAYTTFAVLAALVVVVGGVYLAKRRGMEPRPVLVVLGIMALAAIAGARLLHMIVNYEHYLAEPSTLVSLKFSGFSLYGGIIGAAIAGVITSRIVGISAWRLGDTIAPVLGAGIAVWRLGCYLNGCCFGKVTDSAMGVTFPLLSDAHLSQISSGEGGIFGVAPVHPTQLYELVGALIAGAAAATVLRFQRKRGGGTSGEGLALLTFAAVFTTVRWIVYYFRVYPQTFAVGFNFYPLLYASILAVIALLILNDFRKRSGTTTPAVQDPKD